jgi:hypothetical protein
MQLIQKYCCDFFLQSTHLPVYFHHIMPRHVLSPCYAHYEHTRGIKGYVTYYLACYVRLQVQNMLYYMRLNVQNMLRCHLRKCGWGKWVD